MCRGRRFLAATARSTSNNLFSAVTACSFLGDPCSALTRATTSASPSYAAHYVAPVGDVLRPVLTVHTAGDTLAPAFHESAYAASVGEQGSSELLMQQFTAGFEDAFGNSVNGHCTFTSAQDLAGLDAMSHWLDTGQRPEAGEFFPATLGFLPGFVPAPWPW